MTKFGTPQHFLEIEKLCQDKDAENDRLRAENADLLQAGKIYVAELNRLGAENAELRTFIKNFAYSKELSGRSIRLFANAAYELLAKTAKEGE